MLGLQHLRDVSEDCLVRVLQLVLAAHPTFDDPMTVDTDGHPRPSSPPPLIEFLASFISYPVTAGQLRVAMKKYLTPEDVTLLLMTLEKILAKGVVGLPVLQTKDANVIKSEFSFVRLPRSPAYCHAKTDGYSLRRLFNSYRTFWTPSFSSSSPILQLICHSHSYLTTSGELFDFTQLWKAFVVPWNHSPGPKLSKSSVSQNKRTLWTRTWRE